MFQIETDHDGLRQQVGCVLVVRGHVRRHVDLVARLLTQLLLRLLQQRRKLLQQ